jgi:hypothetical protein
MKGCAFFIYDNIGKTRYKLINEISQIGTKYLMIQPASTNKYDLLEIFNY